MPSIKTRITENIITTLEQITTANGYSFTAHTVEQERLHTRIAGRYPYIELVGPTVTVIPENSTQKRTHEMEYVVLFHGLGSDVKLTEEPITTQYSDVDADLMNALMDKTVDGSGYPGFQRGGLADITEIDEYGYVIDEDENGSTIYVAMVAFKVSTLLDIFDVYKLG